MHSMFELQYRSLEGLRPPVYNCMLDRFACERILEKRLIHTHDELTLKR